MATVDDREGCENSGNNGVATSTIRNVSAVESKFSKLSLNVEADKSITKEESKITPALAKLSTIPVAQENNTPSKWRLASHSFENITELLTLRLWPRQNQQRSTELLKAIKDFKTHELHALDKQGENFLNVLDIPLESDEVLRLYFDRFNSIFFDNALTPKLCYKQWVLCSSEKWTTYMNKPENLGLIIKGETFNQNGFPNEQPSVFIILFEHEHLKSMEPGQVLVAYLGTLLHEMLHAFFRLFGTSIGVNHSCCLTKFWVGHGSTGHGWHWQKTAYEIERFCSEVLDLKIKLGNRLGSLRRELLKISEDSFTEPASSNLAGDNTIEEIGFNSVPGNDGEWIEYLDQTSNDWIHDYGPEDDQGMTSRFFVVERHK